MLIVELETADFDGAGIGFIKIGRLNKAIAKAKNPNIPAAELLAIERKLFAGINAAVQLGKLKPLDPSTLAPLSKSDYGNGIVPLAEVVEWGRDTNLFDFRQPTFEAFTVQGVNDSSTMNRAASEEYQQALEARRSVGRYTLEEAAQFVENNSNANAKSIFAKLKESAQTGELTIHWPGSDEVYKPQPSEQLRMKPSGVRGLEEAYWNDLNAWLEKNEPRLDFKFPKPGAPAGKVEAVKPGITKGEVINAFEGLHFNRNGWKNALEDIPKWIEPCRVTLGRKGDKTTPATWNPVLIAAALYGDKGKGIARKKLDAVFVRLKDWADEWREVSATFCD